MNRTLKYFSISSLIFSCTFSAAFAQFEEWYEMQAERARIEEHINSIADPKLREATRAELERRQTAEKQARQREREEIINQLDRQLILNPHMDLDNLPNETKKKIGASGLAELREAQKKFIESMSPITDDTVFVDLVRQSGDDPDGFADLDLLQYRDKLSPDDWRQVIDWQVEARIKRRELDLTVNILEEAMEIAKYQLAAIGIDDDSGLHGLKKKALFKNLLNHEIQAFRKKYDRAPNDALIMDMIVRLTIPVVIKTPGHIWGDWWQDSKDAYIFEVLTDYNDAVIEPRTADFHVSYEEAKSIANTLYMDLDRDPTNEEIYRYWYEQQIKLLSFAVPASTENQ